MPVNFSRLIVAFVLAFAIPLQGLAAATAGVCMSLGHHQGDMSAHHADPSAPHDHAAGHGHDGDSGHDGDHGASHENDGDSAHCAPCVACCAAASIAPADQVLLAAQSPAAAVAVVPYLHPGFLPEKLDRPPLAL
jgi:hypothetical protein